jgi:hypothetical protein
MEAMKTHAEVENWIRGAAEQFGDPAVPVGQMFVRFKHQNAIGIGLDDVCATYEADELVIGLPENTTLPLPIDTEGARFDPEKGLEAFGIKHICPGLWTLTPSLNIPGFIHVFVTVYGVPRVAPWERRIVVAMSIPGGLKSLRAAGIHG